jgi:hypothetical protein
MQPPRFRLRTLMLIVVIAGLFLGTLAALYRILPSEPRVTIRGSLGTGFTITTEFGPHAPRPGSK